MENKKSSSHKIYISLLSVFSLVANKLKEEERNRQNVSSHFLSSLVFSSSTMLFQERRYLAKKKTKKQTYKQNKDHSGIALTLSEVGRNKNPFEAWIPFHISAKCTSCKYVSITLLLCFQGSFILHYFTFV